MKRHLYCIIAHRDAYCLHSLLKLIDDKRNDIILVVDKKSSLSLDPQFKLKYSNLKKLQKNSSIDIYWGDISQVEAELLSFKEGLEMGEYEYIHLLSGNDLPIKNQDYIHNYFDKLPKGTNLIGFAHGKNTLIDISNKSKFYHPFIKRLKINNKLSRSFYLGLHKVCIFLQKMLHLQRNYGDLILYKGSNWVSITSQFAQFLLDKKDYILKTFKGVLCCDEIYKQSIIMNSPFNRTVLDPTMDNACLSRKIDWTRGTPYVWRYEDYQELKLSQSLFARKFYSDVDKDIIDRICEDQKIVDV